MFSHQAFDQCIVSREGHGHRVGIAQPGAGAVLDVGQEEGDRPVGQRRAGLPLG